MRPDQMSERGSEMFKLESLSIVITVIKSGLV